MSFSVAVLVAALAFVAGVAGAWLVLRNRERERATLAERERAISDLVAPIRDGLARYDAKISELERDRARTYGQLTQRLDDLASTSTALRGETEQLVRALRAPAVRGMWGEVQLRRVCELAGMLGHCDFVEQQTVFGESGRMRPDLVVRLPGNKSVVVDAKVPLQAYLDATDADNEDDRQALLNEHAQHVRAHVAALGRKHYWQGFEPSPEFVVLFLPSESFFSAALTQDPSLLEDSVAHGVVLATPTTLIALLKAVAFGWRQDSLARNAAEISAIGRELYDRLGVLAGHIAEIGGGLSRATAAYNRAVGSIEQRVLSSARRFADLGAADYGSEMVPLEPVDERLRPPPLPQIATDTGSRQSAADQ
jgi:DNA recombination protein RmuC